MDKDLFWRYLEPEHPRMEAFCRKLAGSRENGDDLYQDSLLAAMNKFETLSRPESFRAWLYRIIVNMYKSRLRLKRSRSRLDLSASPDSETGINCESRLNAGIWLERAFGAVSPEERALVTLYELEGWSVLELSEMYGRSVGTIKSRLSRAREKMRRELKKHLSGINLMKVEANYALPRCKTSAE